MEKQQLPGANSSLILGICSILTACCCYGIFGVILGLIGLNKAKKSKLLFEENSELYKPTGNVAAGRFTSLIGIVIGVLYTLYIVYLLSTGELFDKWEESQEIINQMMDN